MFCCALNLVKHSNLGREFKLHVILEDGRQPDGLKCQVMNPEAALLTVERMLFCLFFLALTSN